MVWPYRHFLDVPLLTMTIYIYILFRASHSHLLEIANLGKNVHDEKSNYQVIYIIATASKSSDQLDFQLTGLLH